MFDECAQELLGHNADDLYKLKYEVSEEAYNEVFDNALFKTIIFKVSYSVLFLFAIAFVNNF